MMDQDETRVFMSLSLFTSKTLYYACAAYLLDQIPVRHLESQKLRLGTTVSPIPALPPRNSNRCQRHDVQNVVLSAYGDN